MLALIYLARVLGPADFGKINFSLAMVVYFLLLGDFGLTYYGIREIAKDKTRAKEWAGSIAPLRAGFGLVVFGLLCLTCLFLPKPWEIKLLIVLYGVCLIPNGLSLEWLFRGTEEMKYVGLLPVAGAALYVGLMVAFIRGHEQLLLIACFYVLAYHIFVTAGFLAAGIRRFGWIRMRWDTQMWKHAVGRALPMGVSFMMIQVYYGLGTVMLGFLRHDEEIGCFSAAYRIILFVVALIGAYYGAIFPVTVHTYKTSRESFMQVQSYTARLMVAVAVPLLVGGTVLAKPVITLLYGQEYLAGVSVFRILLWVIPLIALNTVYSRGLLACDRSKEYLIGVTSTAVTNVILNIALVPKWGMVGAAVAAVAAETVALIVFYKEFGEVSRVPFGGYLPKAVAASIGMGMILWYLRQGNVLVLIGAGVIVYFLLMCLTGGVTRADLDLLKHSIRERRYARRENAAA